MITKPTTVFYDLPFVILKITGDDASRFLQGQLTCNIDELADQSASIAAFCNAKGRVISTLLVIKTETDFLLILPSTLVETVRKKLQMYVLRSKVTIQVPTDLQIIGLASGLNKADSPTSEQHFTCEADHGLLFVRMPSKSPRYLCVGSVDTIESALPKDLQTASSNEWQYLDISSGMPWFEITRSEQYIPQMLNIEKLGGISFTKGCYTGQEIVARTHYLGQAKRQLHLAECDTPLPAEIEQSVFYSETKDKCGDILVLQTLKNTTRCLIVLQSVDDTSKSIILGDKDETSIRLLPFE